MHLYVELWSARPAWLALSAQDRQQYFKMVGSEIEKLSEAGVEIVGFAIQDGDTPHGTEHRYLAVWKMPSMAEVEMLERSVEQAGWYDYFDQVNARGELISAPEAIQDMAGLGHG